MMVIDEYHKRTPIRLREYDPLTDRDYVHITGDILAVGPTMDV